VDSGLDQYQFVKATLLDPYCALRPRFLGVVDTDALLSSIDNHCRIGRPSRLVRMTGTDTATLYAADQSPGGTAGRPLSRTRGGPGHSLSCFYADAATAPSPLGSGADDWCRRRCRTELADLIARLEANPVWAMSLGSKELFHSNLLAWCMDHQTSVRDALVQAWTEPEATLKGRLRGPNTPPKVLREYKHFDLLASTPGRQALVIENKMFALPDEGQLAAYSAEAVATLPGTPALILLSLTDPGWPDGRWTAPTGQSWRWRSYDDVRGLLAPLVPAVSRDDPYVGQTLSRWLDLLQSLQHLLVALGSPVADEPLLMTATDRKLLSAARLDAPLQKMRFQHLVRQARVLLPEQTPQMTLAPGLTRTIGLAEGFARGREPMFGWQLQGDQFKLCVEFRSGLGVGTGLATVAAPYERARNYLEFFDFDAVRRLTGNPTREMPLVMDGEVPSFNRYDPGFCYRYLRLGSITFAGALSLAVSYSEHVAAYARQHSTPSV